MPIAVQCSRQARAGLRVELGLGLLATEAARAVDVEDLLAVEHAEAGRVGGALAQLLELGMRVLAQPGRVERGHPQVGDAQAEAVLARGALLEVAERDERDHVAVGGRAAHAELVGDVGDPEHGPGGLKQPRIARPRSSDWE